MSYYKKNPQWQGDWRVFYKDSTDHLIVPPPRCGSTFFTANHDILGLFPLNFNYPIRYKAFKQATVGAVKKTFIYRDPLARLVSFFDCFVYTSDRGDRNKRLFDHGNIVHVYEHGRRSYERFWRDLHKSLPLIKENYMDDEHTSPQHLYFSQHGETSADYDLVNVTGLEKFVCENFIENDLTGLNLTHTPKSYPINSNDLPLIAEIVGAVKEIYAMDYMLIESRNE